ncbi:TetR/AcrR family transcriptional regulator [Catellatospora methionotrophica]|uniref:TetR/AcrR family transcriptional regulator n=1 Tax=Catellatospora methionotrophica TaxID=121620 RepID=UPI0033E067A9
MPKKVDADERRRAIAEAVFRVIETTGSEAVSLRDVAAETGVSMGMVQHYFRTKDEMLMFALDHMGERVGSRLQARLAAMADPTPQQITRAMLTEMLPSTRQSRQEAAVSIAFFNRAVATPAYAAALRDGYRRLLTLVAAQLPPDRQDEADTLFFLTQGLLGPVLLGHFTAEQATTLLDAQLDRAFAPLTAA